MTREVIELYDARAAEYDAWFQSKSGSHLLASELAALKMLMPAQDAAGRTLDIGCGTGVFSAQLAVDVGLDPSLAELRLARSRGLNVVQAVAEALPFKQESFGTALLILSLCFISDPVAALREAARVLTPRGILVCAELNRESAWGAEYLKRKAAGDPFFGLANLYTVSETVTMMRGAGFDAETYASTLRRPPSAEAAVEEPQARLLKDAGFVVIRGRKR